MSKYVFLAYAFVINFNKIASAYGKDHDSVIADWFSDSELPLFVDKEKSLRWLKSRGRQLSKKINHQGSKYIIENNVEKFKEKLVFWPKQAIIAGVLV